VPEEQDQVNVELQKYQEDEEDWDMEFEREGVFGELRTADRFLLLVNQANKDSYKSLSDAPAQ
jgi:hypothetical protein